MMTEERKAAVYFYCDGALENGLGHVSRCLAIAESLREFGIGSVFLGNFCEQAEAMLSEERFGTIPLYVEDEDSWVREIHSLTTNASVLSLVVDSYFISTAALRALRESIDPRLVLMDDTGRHDEYHCDGLVNFTFLSAKNEDRYGAIECFLGPDFFPARLWLREIRKSREAAASQTRGRKAMVFGGGGDDGTLTLSLLSILSQFSDEFEVTVILRRSAKRFEEVEAMFREGQLSGTIKEGNSFFQEALRSADFGFFAGGLIKYECAYAGIPAMIISANDVQLEDSRYFDEEGICLSLGEVGSLDVDESVNRCREFLSDHNRIEAARENGLKRFPQDSSRNIAMAVMGQVMN
ncbi:MAG: hypothetical protein AAF357_05325 [Verrucomicrobiota bacterium]